MLLVTRVIFSDRSWARKNKGFQTCGECGELPCQQFLDLKAPSLSDEEHLVQVDRRMDRLLKNRQD